MSTLESTSAEETELKFLVSDEFSLPDLTIAVAGLTRAKVEAPRKLNAIYYDTEDLRLIRWGITFRRREGGPDEGWHAKLPVPGTDGVTREEIHLPLSAGGPGEIPDEFSYLLTPVTRGAPLVESGRVTTQRQPYLLFDDNGTGVVELVDDLVETSGEPGTSRFREIEVEALVDGADLESIGEVLRNLGAEPSRLAKVTNALGPRAQDPADIPLHQVSNPEDPAAVVLTQMIRKYSRAFVNQDLRVRRDLPDSVHQMRVAARKLRSALKAFGLLVDSTWARQLRTELGWAAGELGATRDTEVIVERLTRHSSSLGPKDSEAVLGVLNPFLDKRSIDATAHATSSLSSPRHHALLEQLVEASNAPKLNAIAQEPARDVMPELLERSFRKLARQVDDLRIDGNANDWHQARITAKRVRYSADALKIAFNGTAERLENSMSEITDILGDHQDACIAQDVLKELANQEGIDGHTGFAIGLLHEREYETEIQDRMEFHKLWPEVQRIFHRTRLN